jgi:desulfoferrodoxin (superoxide reductase-like protein)
MKIVFALCLGLVLIFSASAALAHPPVKIEISYDPATKTVSAVITHPVQDRTNHLIGKVDVDINGEEVIEAKYHFQDTESAQQVSFIMKEAKPGDVIGIEAYCNISGKLKATVEVK